MVRKEIHNKHVYVKIFFQQKFMIFLTFYICSHVKLPAVTKAVNKVVTKSQSEDSDIKIVDEVHEKKPVVHKTAARRGRVGKTQPKKTGTNRKEEVTDVKQNAKQLCVKDLSVILTGLSEEQMSPKKMSLDMWS